VVDVGDDGEISDIFLFHVFVTSFGRLLV